MRIKNERPHGSYSAVVPHQDRDDEAVKRFKEVQMMGQRLYKNRPMSGGHGRWSSFCDGFPAREGSSHGYYGMGLSIMASGEIELRDPCGGSPSSCHTRSAVHRVTQGSIEIVTWGTRPVMYTEDGRKLGPRDYTPLLRYCQPHQTDRAVRGCPTVLIDHDLSIAAVLVNGEDGMYAYWPCEQSYPVTWSSWLVTIENEEVCKVMAAALRKVCKYANAINAVSSAKGLTDAEKAVIVKSAQKVAAEWSTAAPMLQLLRDSRDPNAIAKEIMGMYTSRQIMALCRMLLPDSRVVTNSGHNIAASITGAAAVSGFSGGFKFSTTSQLWQMLREQTAEQYETKFLYTKPLEYRSTWKLEPPAF